MGQEPCRHMLVENLTGTLFVSHDEKSRRGHRKRLKKWSIKTKISKQKNTKNNLLPYFTPNVSNIHVKPKSWLLWSLNTNNVWEDRTLGSPQNSAVPMSPMFGRKSEDHTNTYLYHKQFTHNLYHKQFTHNLLYFTLLYYFTNNLFYFTTFP